MVWHGLGYWFQQSGFQVVGIRSINDIPSQQCQSSDWTSLGENGEEKSKEHYFALIQVH